MKNESRTTYLLPVLGTLLIVALMTGLAEGLGDREILFPEIAALAIGYLCAPKRKWQVDSLRMFVLITGCAAAGFAISCLMPGPLGLKLILAFVLAQIVFLFSGTSLAPMISAVVLPVLIGTQSWLYVLSASGMTLLVILFHALLVRRGIRREEPFRKKALPDIRAAGRLLFRTAVFALLLVPALQNDLLFVVAPPLLVAFTEWTESGRTEPASDSAGKVILIASCALIGAGCRLLFTVQLGLPLMVSSALATLIAARIMIRTGRFLPPAGALTLLAMLIPGQALLLYPVEAALGASVLMLAARAMKQAEYRNAIRRRARRLGPVWRTNIAGVPARVNRNERI